MNALLIYPEIPATYWSFKYALKFVSKKSSHPPLGLATIAAMLPEKWDIKIIDQNVRALKPRDIAWADMVFISAMSIQEKMVRKLINRCKEFHKPIVAGGPLFSEDPDKFPDVDFLVLNEAEITLNDFLNDLESGNPRRIYTTAHFPDIKTSRIPAYELLEINKYATMSLQLSRGCPYNCEFCQITGLYGRKVRLKSTLQIISELNKLYDNKWRGDVFFVDDNFIGNRSFLKKDLLPALTSWMEKRKYPFRFITEASINLADDEPLMISMEKAGFKTIFVGIETVNEESLVECNKHQNKNRDLLASVRKIQEYGMFVMGGFIVGFDHDTPSIFNRQIEFIQKSGIVSAMVGLLNAPKKTRLYERLSRENRIIHDFSGNNTDLSINFIPKMNLDELHNGYEKILQTIYSCQPYYERVKITLSRYKSRTKFPGRLKFSQIKALFRSIIVLGLIRKGRRHFWRLFFWSLFTRPSTFGMAVKFSIYGYHFRRVFNIR
ncbi:MAG: B12-binding domain-containing radical SAM protein [Cyclobacteriaceae bacterium]|nr:B12-binding domain-containing radical SAM protein [Cyclobacteriaceae bacterium]